MTTTASLPATQDSTYGTGYHVGRVVGSLTWPVLLGAVAGPALPLLPWGYGGALVACGVQGALLLLPRDAIAGHPIRRRALGSAVAALAIVATGVGGASAFAIGAVLTEFRRGLKGRDGGFAAVAGLSALLVIGLATITDGASALSGRAIEAGIVGNDLARAATVVLLVGTAGYLAGRTASRVATDDGGIAQ